MRNHVILILLASLVLVMGACTISHKFGPFMGKVVDAETGEPIEGAVILIVFTIESSSLGGSVNSFAGAIETLTDTQGEFKFTPKRINYFKMNASWDDDYQVSIFKPGYGAYPGHRQAYSSWKKDEQSLVIPENKYITYYLPKLESLKERKENLLNIREPGAIPIEKRQNMQRLQSEERVNVGLKPYKKWR